MKCCFISEVYITIINLNLYSTKINLQLKCQWINYESFYGLFINLNLTGWPWLVKFWNLELCSTLLWDNQEWPGWLPCAH